MNHLQPRVSTVASGFRYAAGGDGARLELENVRVCDGWNDEAPG
jgi:hypothetical protein